MLLPRWRQVPISRTLTPLRHSQPLQQLAGEISSHFHPIKAVQPSPVVWQQAASTSLLALCNQLYSINLAQPHHYIGNRYQAPRGQLGAGMKVVLEMVEVKNTSPFQQHATMTRRGKPRVHYALSDRGPRQQVPTYWVPQLQMEMLAGGASSALLVSRSATKGMTLFRMARDDSYLRQMLAIISRFYRTYVRRNCRPPYNMFSERPDYQQFLRHTASLARETPALLHQPVLPGRRAVHRIFAEWEGSHFRDGQEVDHENGNYLDNTRGNLHAVSRTENLRNRGLLASNTSGYKGVSWSGRNQKWEARVRVNGRQTFLCYFNSAMEV
ncbi:hypothetical protein WJX72_002943 [[Myrmecia] bisecta]|uniref:HNH endonuclease n=1 Tax=[Myrmecia] bisecta TaxID=41462 RepID=A0AAW1P3S4_9CHLO